MKLKHYILIPLTMLLALAPVIALTWVNTRSANEKNGFIRTFANDFSPRLVSVIERDKEISDIAGATDYHIYFKTKTPGRVIETDLHLQNKRYVEVNIPFDKNTASAFTCIVDSPYIKILAGNVPAIMFGEFGKQATIHRIPKRSFTRGVSISNESYILRGVDSTVKMDQIFTKRNTTTGELIREDRISEIRHDMGFSTDGLLSYDNSTQLITYVLFLRNQFICMDTNLNLVYKMHTIDTLNSYQTTASKVGNKVTNISPSRFINGISCADNGSLYNNSQLNADNETAEAFKNNSVIDVYNIKTGQYKGSFYIPAYDGNKFTMFKIINNYVIAIYKKKIAVYVLNYL